MKALQNQKETNWCQIEGLEPIKNKMFLMINIFIVHKDRRHFSNQNLLFQILSKTIQTAKSYHTNKFILFSASWQQLWKHLKWLAFHKPTHYSTYPWYDLHVVFTCPLHCHLQQISVKFPSAFTPHKEPLKPLVCSVQSLTHIIKFHKFLCLEYFKC